MDFKDIRQNLLNEAKASPNLLSDMAGLENYISESYNNRSFIELLQNADDANSTKFKILKRGSLLFVANDGRPFDPQDLESLCRSASSNKVKGETIGYRGIGFKSVVGFSKEIHLLSEDLELTFSKEKTKLEIPKASKVPLIRIPHPFDNSDKELIKPFYEKLKSEGYKTIFAFTGITAEGIESEFNSLEYNSLLFLRNITKTEIFLDNLITTEIIKEPVSKSEIKVTFKTNNSNSYWLISNENKSSIAFSIQNQEITKLEPEKSLLHAFLPTEDANGLGVLINGNFSTDPSRKHLIMDSETIESIKLCSRHIVKLWKHKPLGYSEENTKLINALIPFSDPRMSQFSNNKFLKELLKQIKTVEPYFFKGIKLCPDWLNPKDFNILFKEVKNGVILDKKFYGLEGFHSFIKFLGASEVQFKEIIPKINNSKISLLGCVQLTKTLFKSIILPNDLNESELLSLKILYSEGKRKSIIDLKKDSGKLDDSFISLLLENGLTEFDINQILRKYIPNSLSQVQDSEKTHNTIPDSEISSDQNQNPVSNWFRKATKPSKPSIQPGKKRWRTAEKQTLEILNANGFQLQDVSKQNIGCDLEGIDPDGSEIQIEIKSITLPGQKFRLTNNEIAVAQDKQKSFFVAIVRQVEDTFEIALVSDPVNNLALNRQCLQWVWECESYEYNPMIFEIES